MKLKDSCHVNRDLLPYKLHFFFLYGGFAGVMPFIPIIGKQLGISATAIGVGCSMLPIFIFLSEPLIGILVDYFQNIKKFLVFILVVSSFSHFSLLSIPAIDYETDNAAYVRVSSFNDSESFMNISVPFEKVCLEELLQNEIHCKLRFENDILVSNYTESTFGDLISPINITYNKNEYGTVNKESDDKFWITFYIGNISLPDIKYKIPSIKLLHCSPEITQCSVAAEAPSDFASYQFWTFISITIIATITALSAMTLSDAGCYETLGAKIEDYGRQRLFGTISWGLVCSLTGILNDMTMSTEKTFLPGFYLLALFIAIDVITVCVINIPKAHVSSNMCKDFKKIFSSKEILIFSFGVAFSGFLNCIIEVYEFWFLEDIGASRTLLGLAVAMQCLVGEVPFLFFSGWLVSKLGHFLCLVCVFSGFAIRFICYTVLKDPWLVLPVDVLHGLTFGLYQGVMTSFAKAKAPKGMEATLLGIFGGLYNGLGYGFGSFLGGIGLDHLGQSGTFLTTSILSFGCVLIFLVVSYVFRAPTTRGTFQVVPTEDENLARE